MKKVKLAAFVLAATIGLATSCKPTVKVQTDYDRNAHFSSYKTFSLYYLVTSRNINELNEERIWNAIRTEMISKGYVENNQHPDLVVNAVSVLKNKKYVSASSSATSFGAIRPYGYWTAAPVGVSRQGTVRVENYKDGSLLIEVTDAKTRKLLWEGTATAELNKRPEDPDKAIRETVKKVMVQFPVCTGQNQ